MKRWIWLALLGATAAPAFADDSSVLYKGLQNQALGQACLSVDPTGSVLTVSNIGTSGQDGLAIEAPPYLLEFELALPDAASGVDGAYVELEAQGVLFNVPDQRLWTMRIEDQGSQYGLSIDAAPLQPFGLSLVLGLGESVFVDAVDYAPAPPASEVLATFATGALRVWPLAVGNASVFAELRFEDGGPIALPAGAMTPLVASRLGITGSGGAIGLGAVSRLELRAAHIEPLIVLDEDTLQDCIDTTGLAYCSATTSSAGCVSTLGFGAESSCSPLSGASDHSLVAGQVQGQKNGLFFYGLGGPAAIPFSGGTLCVQPPLGRGPIQFAGGSGPQGCDGELVQVTNGSAGFDPGPGGTAWIQAWYRDPANTFGVALSNAVRLDYH